MYHSVYATTTLFYAYFVLHLQGRKSLSEDYETEASGREGWWRTYIRVRNLLKKTAPYYLVLTSLTISKVYRNIFSSSYYML